MWWCVYLAIFKVFCSNCLLVLFLILGNFFRFLSLSFLLCSLHFSLCRLTCHLLSQVLSFFLPPSMLVSGKAVREQHYKPHAFASCQKGSAPLEEKGGGTKPTVLGTCSTSLHGGHGEFAEGLPEQSADRTVDIEVSGVAREIVSLARISP